MARLTKLSEKSLASATARTKLAVRVKPHYIQIAQGKTLGYVRRAAGAGRWVLRELVDGKYAIRTLGSADDVEQPNGVSVLDLPQAKQIAGRDDALTTAIANSKRLTVNGACELYLANMKADGRSYTEEYRKVINTRITPTDLGKMIVTRVTRANIKTWMSGQVRTDGDEDDTRKSQSTANRVLNVLRAALNFVYKDDAYGIVTDKPWKTAEPFRNVSKGREDVFDETQVARLIEKARTFNPAYATLLHVAYLTGARYGELIALRVRDFDPKLRQLTVSGGTKRARKTGARTISLHPEDVMFFKGIAGNRKPDDLLLLNNVGSKWMSCGTSVLMKQSLTLAKLPLTAVFYTLRHSHISNAIQRGMNLKVIAENCGTSLMMIERHYGKVITAMQSAHFEKTAPRLRIAA